MRERLTHLLIPLGVALMAGAVGSVAFPPVHQPVAMVASLGVFLGVLWWIRDRSAWLSTFAGTAYGAGFMAILIWWMNAVSSGAYVALVIAQTVMYAFVGLALRLVMRLPAWPLWGAAVWVGFETVRGSQPFSGFPWGRLVHVTADTPLDAWTRLLGAPATSALVFLVIALIVAAVVTTSRVRVVTAATATVGTVLIGIVLPTGPAGPTRSIEIAVVQGDVPGAFGSWPRGEIFLLHAEATQALADDIAAGERPEPEFVLWPENSLDVDPERFPRTTEILTELEEAVGAPILVGGILDGPDADTAYNAGFVWENGQEQARYVKRNLVPYGEYVPFRQALGDLVPRVDRDIPRDMLPGDAIGTLDIGGVRVGDAICWDIAYDTAIADAVLDGAELLVVQTSNASFTGTAQPDQQWLISKLRAVETGRSLAVASTNGISGVVDASGDTLALAPREQAAVLSVEVQLAGGETWGVKLGRYWLWMLCIAAVAGMAFGGREVRERRRGRTDFQ